MSLFDWILVLFIRAYNRECFLSLDWTYPTGVPAGLCVEVAVHTEAASNLWKQVYPTGPVSSSILYPYEADDLQSKWQTLHLPHRWGTLIMQAPR